MTFQISRNGKILTPISIETQKNYSRRYSLSKQELAIWKKEYPDVSFRFDRDTVRVDGPFVAVAKWDNFYRQQLSTKSSTESSGNVDTADKTTSDPSIPFSRRRFTATITGQPIRLILASYAKTLETEIVIDEESFKQKGVSLDQRVSLELKNATIEESLQQCLDPIGGTFQISDSEIKVFAK